MIFKSGQRVHEAVSQRNCAFSGWPAATAGIGVGVGRVVRGDGEPRAAAVPQASVLSDLILIAGPRCGCPRGDLLGVDSPAVGRAVGRLKKSEPYSDELAALSRRELGLIRSSNLSKPISSNRFALAE